MSKYTPGPWKCDAASFTDSDAVAYEVSADWMTISAANARLIAAAPDMAEAIQAFLTEHDNCGSPAFEGLRAALAKAGL